MNILVINAGSSSLKYQLFDMEKHSVKAKGLCERIGIDGRLKHKASKETVLDIAMPDHAGAIKVVMDILTSKEDGVLKSMDEIDAIGHRVVHGGEHFNKSVIIDDDVIKAIEDCFPLAPLHNPPNLTGIRACMDVAGDIPQVVVFDTAFHQSISKDAFLYPIPYEYYNKYKIRRYGFHGTSVRYVTERGAEILGKKPEELKIIVCHLGNGSSVTAVEYGKSADTSMGFTPLEGVPMGTRSGSIDPTICGFLAGKEGITASEVISILNKKSGVLGVSGLSSDFRDLHEEAKKNPSGLAQTALNIFARSVCKYIGSYAAVMNGCDAVIFTAGIGENNAYIRSLICRNLEYMGFELDEDKNNVMGREEIISKESSKGKLLVVPTNEELVIARDTEALVKSLK